MLDDGQKVQYAAVTAPPTTVELVDRLDEKYGIEIPLVDLFRWGGPRSSAAEIKSGVPAAVCRHHDYACRC